MDGDIRFDGGRVVVEGDGLHVTATDLTIDSPARRKGASPQHRRALVHGTGDRLAINFNGDYPGGVTIGGHVRIGNLTADDMEFGIEQSFVKEKGLNGLLHRKQVQWRHASLRQIIADLQSQINELKKEVEALKHG